MALDLVSGRRVEQWLEAGNPGLCPYDTSPDAVLIAHNAAAEVLCHIVLGWPLPAYVIDTWAEFRVTRNGTNVDRKAGLLEAAINYGCTTITAAAKVLGRAIAMQGRAHAETQRDRLVRYCWSDVDTNADLLRAMLPDIVGREQGLALALVGAST